MSRINRIGNKLGVAGALGILLSIGMVANQTSTESSVEEANRRANVEQQVSDAALKAESEMRNMQLAVRGVRLARTKEAVAQSRAEFQAAQSAQEKLIDGALALAFTPESKELFAKIKSKSQDYAAGADEQAALMLKVLELNGKRISISAEWDTKFDKTYASLGSIGSPHQGDIEVHLRDADGALNAVRAAGWRFFATGETDQKEKIVRNAAILSGALAQARSLVVDQDLSDGIDTLTPLVKQFLGATDEVIEADLQKDNISRTRTIPIANEVAALLRTALPVAQKAVA
jgi:CHASE3 domain sensor protein